MKEQAAGSRRSVAQTFPNRLEAGRQLAEELTTYRGSDAVVIGLARGGVVVGYAVAEALGLPLQAIVVRKIGAPRNPEMALGAVSETGALWLDRLTVEETGASEQYLQAEIAARTAEARERRARYVVGSNLIMVQHRPAIVVDDGIATGATAVVAAQSVRGLGAAEVVLATPVSSSQATWLLERRVDRLVTLLTPKRFVAVGLHYEDFNQVSDEEVVCYLALANP
jgi:putative phosphoribosyl transferase